ncbi:hypothetical protein GDO86_012234, partial [Hymenochirus boettgeri]
VNSQRNKEPIPGFVIRTLESVTMQRGLCVQIPCTFIIDTYRYTLTRDAVGIWYKGYGESFVAASNNPSLVSVQTKGRFTLTGNVSGGDCSLSITDVQYEDNEQYNFRVEDWPLKYTYYDLNEPEISPVKKLIAGEQVTLTCTAPGHCPGTSPTFTWKGNINPDRVQDYELLLKDGNIIHQSNFTFTPSQKDHNTELTCTVTYRTASSNCPVLHKYSIPLGSSLSLICTANSNPPASFFWTTSGQYNTTNNNGLLFIHNVTMDNNGEYICRAKNKYGQSHSSIIINIT